MTRRQDPPRWRHSLRSAERALTWGYLAALGAGLFALALPPVRHRGFRLVERVIRVWDARWFRRLELGEGLVRAGRYQEAADYLSRLDREFPARDVRHALDQERERLLVALGRSYTELGAKQRAIETYGRLVAFDPRNYRNYYAQAMMANRLLAGWAPAPEARDAFLEALRINPSHLPSVRGAIAYHSARGEFAEVVRLYQDYLDAYLRQSVTLYFGEEAKEIIDVPVDGAAHDYDVPLARPAGWSGDLRIATGGFALALDRAQVVPSWRAGEAAQLPDTELPVDAAQGRGMARLGQSSWRADGADGELRLRVPLQMAGIRGVRVRLRLFKPMDPSTWAMVFPAYRNRIDEPGLAAAQGRTVLLPTAAAADSVLEFPFWAKLGHPTNLEAAKP